MTCIYNKVAERYGVFTLYNLSFPKKHVKRIIIFVLLIKNTYAKEKTGFLTNSLLIQEPLKLIK